MDVVAMIRDAGTVDSRLDGASIIATIERFAATQRSALLERGVALTKHVDGRVLGAKVSDRREDDGSGQRVRLTTLGEIPMQRPASAGFTLAIKHPVAFTALLPTLLEAFPVFAIVRNPLAVMASWESVPMAVREGRLGLPAAVAPAIDAALERIDDRLERQLTLLNWFFESYATALSSGHVIRYEDIVASGGAALAAVDPTAADLSVALQSRNAARVYDRAHMRAAAALLLERGGAYRDFYDAREIEQALAAAG